MAKKQKVTVVEGVLTCSYPTIGKKFVRKLADYPRGIYVPCDAADHGIEQKFGDAKSGKTPAEKFEEVRKIDASLMAGEWNRTAGPVDRTPEILAAVCALKSATVKEIEKKPYLVHTASGGKIEITAELIAGWGSAEDVRVEIQRARLERAEKIAKEHKAELVVEFK